jgi:PAS domain S-box-containing protein
MLKFLSKHSSLGVLVVDLKNKNIETNPKYHEILDNEFSHDFSLQLFKNLINLIDNRILFLTQLKLAKRNKTNLVGDFKLKKNKNSLPQWLSIDAYFLYDKNEKAESLVISIVDITTAKHNENIQKLIASAVANVNHAIVITEAEPIDDPGPRILYVNDSFTETTGYTFEEVLGKSPRILQGPKTDKNTLDEIKNALKKWQPIKCEILNYKKSGEEFWVELDIQPVKNEKGWYTHWVSVQRDVTKLKIAEAKIKDGEKRLKQLVNDSPDLIQSIGLHGEIIFTNTTWRKMLGYSEEEIKNLNIFSVIDDSFHEVCMKEFQHIMSGQPLQNVETIFKTKDGKKIYLLGNAAPNIIDGKVVGTQGFFKDITEQKQAETALKNNILKTERILNSLNECVWGVSLPDYKLEFQSPSTFDLYEYPMEDWIRNINLWIDCIHPDDREEILLKSNDLYQYGEVIQEYRIITGTKKIKWISSTSKLIKNEIGTPVLMTGISADITQRKLADQKLIESELNQKNLLNSSLELIFSLSKEGNILFANKTFQNAVNNQKILSGELFFKNCIHKIYLEKFIYHFNLALNNEIIEKLSFSVLTDSGKEIHLKGNMIPLIKNNELIAIQCFFLDITQKIELQKDKLQFELELKKVQNNEKIGTFVYDIENHKSLLNDDVLNELLGIDSNFSKNIKKFFVLIHPDDRKVVNSKYLISIANKSKFQEEFRILRQSDKSVRWVKYVADFEYNEKDTPIKSTGTVRDITLQKKSELELKKITEQVDYLYKNSDEIIFTIDSKKEKIVYISKCTLGMYGLSNEDFYKNYSLLISLIHPDDLIKFLNDREQLLFGTSSIKEYRIIHHQTNEIKWVEFILTSHLDDENKVTSINIITKDITSRKNNELELKTTLTELKQYQDAINRSAIVSITDTKGIITFVNDKFSEISKYPKDELINRPHSIVNSGFHSKAFFEELWNTIKSGAIWKGQIKNKTKTGEFYWVDSTIIPFMENGKPYQYLSIRYNITESIRIKDEIVTQKQFYETILNEMPADIAVFDKNYRYVYLNPNAVKDEQIRNLMIGKTDFDYAELKNKDVSIAKKRQELLREATKTKAGITFEETLQINELEKKYMLRKTYPYYDINNDVQYVIGFGIDITKEKLHELSLAQSLIEKETLLGEIHHRVKNNLALIDGVVELKKALEKDKYIVETLSDIQSRIKTVALVHQKLYQNELFSNIDIKDYINELVLYQQKLFNKQNLETVKFEVAVEDISFDISKSVSLGLLLNELVSNSLKYGIINNQVIINISLVKQGNSILLTYKDSGKGLQQNIKESTTKGFGFKLIQSLIKQFKASHEIIETNHFEMRVVIPIN